MSQEKTYPSIFPRGLDIEIVVYQTFLVNNADRIAINKWTTTTQYARIYHNIRNNINCYDGFAIPIVKNKTSNESSEWAKFEHQL